MVLKNTDFRHLRLVTDGALLSPSFDGVTDNQTLYLSDSDSAAHAPTHRYRDYLGHEFSRVIIDCRDTVNFDAIATVCGTIMAGGELSLLIPLQPTPALKRLIDCWQAIPEAESTDTVPARLPTVAQQHLIEQLRDTETVHIVIAPRGRGKSACLGTALATTKNAAPCIVTAPRKANAQVLLKHAPDVQFVAWDTLVRQTSTNERLIIDEAAGIPLWAIQRLVKNYPTWMLATTVDGYEGCGRGFAVHFVEWAKRSFAKVSLHTLEAPLRWLANDPLEHWLNQSLLLSPAPEQLTHQLNSGVYHASDLPECALHQAFELLLEAHYQSSPNDLKMLLDEPQQYLYLHIENKVVAAVAWIALEGPLSQALATQVQLGKRRPPGNLLPQSLSYFLQSPDLATLHWCRVSRIAVQQGKRRQRIASDMLNAIRSWAKSNQIDALGTSFGYEPGLAQFWKNNGYRLVRLSSKQDRVSARYASLWVSPLTPQVESQCVPLYEWGDAQYQWWFDQQLPTKTYSATANKLLRAFNQYILPLDSALCAIATVSDNGELRCSPADFRVPEHTIESLKRTYAVDTFKQLSAVLRSDIAKLL